KQFAPQLCFNKAAPSRWGGSRCLETERCQNERAAARQPGGLGGGEAIRPPPSQEVRFDRGHIGCETPKGISVRYQVSVRYLFPKANPCDPPLILCHTV